jgi:hypothetical protein
MHNFTAGHETLAREPLPRRLDYPDEHIEVDNRLFFYLGLLEEAFGAEPFYVHLLRDEQDVVRSLLDRWDTPISLGQGWERTVMMRGAGTPQLHAEAAADAVTAMNAGIRVFLRDKPRQQVIHLEDCPEAFGRFWDAVGAVGDRDSAMAEWSVSHNAGPPPVPSSEGTNLRPRRRRWRPR